MGGFNIISHSSWLQRERRREQSPPEGYPSPLLGNHMLGLPGRSLTICRRRRPLARHARHDRHDVISLSLSLVSLGKYLSSSGVSHTTSRPRPPPACLGLWKRVPRAVFQNVASASSSLRGRLGCAEYINVSHSGRRTRSCLYWDWDVEGPSSGRNRSTDLTVWSRYIRTYGNLHSWHGGSHCLKRAFEIALSFASAQFVDADKRSWTSTVASAEGGTMEEIRRYALISSTISRLHSKLVRHQLSLETSFPTRASHM